jgi:hypothetical protein
VTLQDLKALQSEEAFFVCPHCHAAEVLNVSSVATGEGVINSVLDWMFLTPGRSFNYWTLL